MIRDLGSNSGLRVAFALALFVVAQAAPTSPAGASQLAGQRVDGLHRLCTYRTGPLLNQQQTYEVGRGQGCPAQLPVLNPQVQAPPTAMLSESTIQNGRRQCVYTQGVGRWSFAVRLNQSCPVNVGMLLKQRAEQSTGL
jgi:hypothetical protein